MPLFARERTQADAEHKCRDWLPDAASRVTRVTQKTEVVWESFHGQRNKDEGDHDKVQDYGIPKDAR